jgi:putative tryptophan/tyrosine transport system substrate-binding protein
MRGYRTRTKIDSVTPVDRRAFITRIAAIVANSAAATVSHRIHAQQAAFPRHIAVLPQVLDTEEAEQFRQGLRDAGYSEGRDVVIDWRIAPGDTARLPALVGDLVQRKVDVIVVTTTFAAQAAKRATSTIPIVMASIADPVGAGLVEDLAHPGGNITGLSLMETDLHVKRLELLKEALPGVTRVAVLWNPSMPSHPKAVQNLKAAAPSMSIALHFIGVKAPEELNTAFATMAKVHAQALYVLQDQLFTLLLPNILKVASKAHLPVIHANKYVAQAGALMSYGPHVGDLFRRAAGYVDKILKGAKPGELPVEQPTKFELAVNLKSARALGITIPESFLLRADQVIR